MCDMDMTLFGYPCTELKVVVNPKAHLMCIAAAFTIVRFLASLVIFYAHYLQNKMDLAEGFIQTVLGPIKPDQLGQTLCHEHLYCKSYSRYFVTKPLDNIYSYLDHERVRCENRWYTSYHFHRQEDNLDLTGPDITEAMRQELTFFKNNGGGSIVEVTTFGHNLETLAQLSAKTRVNIVGSTGFYVNHAFPDSIKSMSIEGLCSKMRDDLITGTNGIKPGVIGEIGTCWPIDPFEKNVLKASAQLQSELKVPVIIHPGRDSQAPMEIMRIFTEAGGSVTKTVMSHLERTLDMDGLLEFAKTGAICEFDLFGQEVSYYEAADDLDMPNDAQRIGLIKKLINEGFGHQITISHDIHTKHRLMKYGGHGFSHIHLNAIPKMLRRGISQEQIDQIMVKTPQRWLTL